jgi:HPr kinase/phosphorylase
VQLELWKGEGGSYDRIGLEDRHYDILGVPIREVVLPVRPGRNMSSIIEIAARNELLRQAGHHAARDFVERIDSRLTRSESDRPAAAAPLRRALPNESSAPPPVEPSRRR